MSASSAPRRKYAPPVPPVAMEMNFVSAARTERAQQRTAAGAAQCSFIGFSSLHADRDHRLAEDVVEIDVATARVQQVMGQGGQPDAQVAHAKVAVLDAHPSGLLAEGFAGREAVGKAGAGRGELGGDEEEAAGLRPIRLAP